MGPAPWITDVIEEHICKVEESSEVGEPSPEETMIPLLKEVI